MRRRYRILGSMALLALLLDQVSKAVIIRTIPEHKPVTVIAGVFDLVNIRNRGAAFGFLNRSDIEWQFWLFLIATVAAVWTIFVLVRSAQDNCWLFTGLGLVMGGALGNLLDRIQYRAVVDFLDLYWQDWHWPAFNIADSAICVGAILSCLVLCRERSENAKDQKEPKAEHRNGGSK
ncbi:MAG: signal peptidase II [Desulfovibrio sp.]|nr:signal peptidase II [Desulfovibrio sp.]